MRKRARRLIVVGLCVLLSGCMALSTDQQVTYGLNHYDMGLYNQAIPPLVSAAESLAGKSPSDPRLVDVLIALGDMARATGRMDLAAEYFPRALRTAEALQPKDLTRLRNSLVYLGNFYSARQPADAVTLLERAERISATLDDPVLHAIDIDNLAVAYQGLKNYPRAIALGHQALQLVERYSAAKRASRTTGTILSNLGQSYFEAGDAQQAEVYFKRSILVLRSVPGEVEQWRVKVAIHRYKELLTRTGRIREAEALDQELGAERE